MEKTKEIIDYLKFSTKLRVLRYAKVMWSGKTGLEKSQIKPDHFTSI